MNLTDKRQMQLATTSLSNDAASIYNFGTQKSALGGRGIIVTALLMYSRTTAPNIKVDFDSVVINMMALLLSIYDTDCREDGIAVIAFVGLNYLITRLGE